jgi:hypothetical protein
MRLACPYSLFTDIGQNATFILYNFLQSSSTDYKFVHSKNKDSQQIKISDATELIQLLCKADHTYLETTSTLIIEDISPIKKLIFCVAQLGCRVSK